VEDYDIKEYVEIDTSDDEQGKPTACIEDSPLTSVLCWSVSFKHQNLCYFCDVELPERPHSEALRDALFRAWRDSEPLPTEENPFSRHADVATRMALCTVHKEEEVREVGRSQNWPTKMDWDNVVRRVQLQWTHIAEIIADKGDPFVYRTEGEVHVPLHSRGISNGPRMRCTFWTSFMERAEQVGPAAVLNTGNQLGSFKNEQPG
jgi:hypothetical protein